MIRKHLAVALAAVLLASGSAGASREPAPAAPAPTRVANAAECGGVGFTKLLLPGTKYGFGCVHTAHDLAPELPVSAAAAARPAAAKVPCYGDGTTGPRIQVIYGYYSGLRNRSKTVTAQFRNTLAPRMQAVINGQSHGQDLGLRFAMVKGCKGIDVKTVKFPVSVQNATDPRDPGGQLSRAAQHLDKIGMNRDDRKYLIMWDGWNVGACGIAFLATGHEIFSAPVAPFSDGLPTIGGRTDPGKVFKLGSTNVSMVFNHVGAKNGPSCFTSRTPSTVTTIVHELFHNLGAVQLDAPNADTGHCSDAPSVMCSGNSAGYGQGIRIKACLNVRIETLDCGEDDYWNPAPPANSYLATHLNIAKSQFFGLQPQDLLEDAPL